MRSKKKPKKNRWNKKNKKNKRTTMMMTMMKIMTMTMLMAAMLKKKLLKKKQQQQAKQSRRKLPKEQNLVVLGTPYNKLQSAHIPTGDPNCPTLVCQAKRIHQDIEEKMDPQEELNNEGLGFPSSDVEDNIAVTSPAPAVAVTATVATTTVPEAHNSPALFCHAKRAKLSRKEF